MVFVLAGICDVTKRNPVSKKVVLRMKTRKEIKRSLCASYKACFEAVKPHLNAAKLIFCPLDGIHLSTYNKEVELSTGSAQHAVDRAVVKINAYIEQLNASNGVVGPRLDPRTPGEYSGLYDGLHPTRQLVDNWATCIAQCVCINM